MQMSQRRVDFLRPRKERRVSHLMLAVAALFFSYHGLRAHAQDSQSRPPLAEAQSAGRAAAQEPNSAAAYTYADGSPAYYRNMHGAKREVFRRDPNIWVYTREVALRSGMPLEWASDELKGVAAAAFRMERDGAEEDCGWGGNPNACQPVYRCVLELYFDRQEHRLPWDAKRMVADFYWQDVSSAVHMLPAIGWVPEANGDVSRGNKKSPNYPELAVRQPFTDPETGDELFFNRLQVRAYDREIHGRYAFVRLDFGCDRGPVISKPLVLQLQNKRMVTKPGHKDSDKVFHEIYLPASWNRQTLVVGQQERKRNHEFYKKTWDELIKGERK